MAHQAYVPQAPADEAKLEAPFEPHPFRHVLTGLGSAVARPREIRDALFGPDEDKSITSFQTEVEADAKVTSTESDWLDRLFQRNGERDEFEQALLAFLAEDGARPF